MDNGNVTPPMPPQVPPVMPETPNSGLKPAKTWSDKRLIIGVVVIVIVAIGLIAWVVLGKNGNSNKSNQTSKVTSSKVNTANATVSQVQGLQLNTAKNYGNKYSNGILPVGDGKYTTGAPKTGYVYACSQYARTLASSQGGASVRGPWFTDNNTEYNINEKIHVQGDVMWQASFTNTTSGNTRTIVTNDLPSQPTGIFPIATTDPAYAYDHNPNTIKAQDLTYNLPLNPTYGQPNCMGGEAGIMLTGIVLFNALDAGGRDAGAWEIQDSCDGHPQSDGIYHYHTLSSCIKNVSASTVIGYALDGFPITGPEIAPNDYLTTDDLDECHGIVSKVYLDNKYVETYHYVMTEDFPYSVSCFRGTPIEAPDLAQNQANQGQTGQNSPPKQSQPAPR